MEKNYLDGVVPPAQKRSIRDIPVPARGRKSHSAIKRKKPEDVSNSESIPATPAEQNNTPESPQRSRNNRRGGRGKKYLIGGSIVILLALLFIIISSFDSATVKIQPKTVSASINKSLTIGDLSDSESLHDVGYRTIELARESELEVSAESEEFVQQNASGVITIYNSYSDENQNLIRNTRFESPDGLIYKIQESVSVPGYTGSGDNLIPGQLDVEVVAAEPGEEYNTDSAEFTIPGFEGQEPYDFFSAKTKTAISGGFDGIRKIVSEEDINSASAELQNNAKAALVEELQKQVTDEFIVVYNDESFTYMNITQEDAPSGDNVILKLKAEVVAKVFDKVDLSNAIALNTINEYAMTQDVLVDNLEDASLVISDVSEVQEIEDEEGEVSEITIYSEKVNVTGDLTFVWQNNIEKVKASLANVKREELGSIMQDFAGISKAEAVIKPFWRSKFPTDPKNIKVEFIQK